MNGKQLKLVYCTPSLYMAGGVERVLTLKANYFAEHYGYDITIILTDGAGKPPFYPLSDKVKVINLDVDFEELWTCSFFKQIFVYLKKQRIFKRRLTKKLMELKPDITISLLRREINFINKIPDGSKKIGELHVNRIKYRYYEANNTNCIKNLFAKFWMRNLIGHLKRLERFVVLTEEDRLQWPEIQNVIAIPDPLTFYPKEVSTLSNKRVIAVGRYEYQKGFDLLLQAWSLIEKQVPDWELAIFGQGERGDYEKMVVELGIDKSRCHLNGPTNQIQEEYLNSSIFAFSSRYEGFGMALVEAMSCGLPAVSFACPCGPKDIIKDREDGFLIKTGDEVAFADALLKLIQDDKLRKFMAGKAREDVKRFQMESLADKWKELFKGL